MSNKMIDSKRREHANKILQKVSKKGGPDILHAESSSEKSAPKKSSKNSNVEAVKEHYNVIREDILKLREDLNKGYEMAKGLMDKGVIRSFLTSK